MNRKEIKFQFNSIEIIEFSFHNHTSPYSEDTIFGIDANIKHKVNIDAESIEVVNSFNIFLKEDQKQLAKAEISCVYHVENINNLVNDEGVFEMPSEFAGQINSTSLSTCRGILYTLFRGTQLHTVILPVIDSKNIVKTHPEK